MCAANTASDLTAYLQLLGLDEHRELRTDLAVGTRRHRGLATPRRDPGAGLNNGPTGKEEDLKVKLA
ncbi:hypothetical protein [Streptomyces sp. NPDC001980]|uniref:hypothetical protein n=1 Tax=Streptomyces sp. NPDC001980 TaxID=3157126 RepID=UPI00331881CD